jgi:hypothetical protein
MRDFLHKNAGPLLLLAVLTAIHGVLLVMLAWCAPRGLHFLDECLTLLAMNDPVNSVGNTAGFQYVLQPVLKLHPMSLVGHRWFHWGLCYAGGGMLAWGVLRYAAFRGFSCGLLERWNFVLLVLLGSVAAIPIQATSYNTLSGALAGFSVGTFLAAVATENRWRRILWLLACGWGIASMALARWPSCPILIAALTFLVFFLQPRKEWVRSLALFPGSLVFSFPAAIGFYCMVEPSLVTWLHHVPEISRILATFPDHNPSGQLLDNLKAFEAGARFYAPMLIPFVTLQVLARTRWWPKNPVIGQVTFLILFATFVLMPMSDMEWWNDRFQRRTIGMAYITMASGLLMLPGVWERLAPSRWLVLFGAFLALNLFLSLGSATLIAMDCRYYAAFSFAIIGIAFLELSKQEKTKVAAWVVLAFVLVLSVLYPFQHNVWSPPGIMGPRIRQDTKWRIPETGQTIFLRAPAVDCLRQIHRALKKSGIKVRHPVLVFSYFPGYVYTLNLTSPFTTHYDCSPDRQSVNQYLIGNIDQETLKQCVVIIQRPVSPEIIKALADKGINFPGDYKRVLRMKNPFPSPPGFPSEPYVSVYVPLRLLSVPKN